jgi:hypothetical protein
VTKRRYKLCDEDQREYGGPEWVVLDFDKFTTSRAKHLERIEREVGMPLRHIMAAIQGEGTAVGARALVWIARDQNGLRTPFRDFDIHTLQVDVEVVPDDEDEAVTDTAPLDDSPANSETTST